GLCTHDRSAHFERRQPPRSENGLLDLFFSHLKSQRGNLNRPCSSSAANIGAIDITIHAICGIRSVAKPMLTCVDPRPIRPWVIANRGLTAPGRGYIDPPGLASKARFESKIWDPGELQNRRVKTDLKNGLRTEQQA
ncbi:MAG: hypothetical protein ACI9HK_005967, partial [Pirellulaceae bacterium]